MPSALDLPMPLPTAIRGALQARDPDCHAEIILGALEHIECNTWVEYLTELTQRQPEPLSAQATLSFANYLERHLSMLIAGPEIDPAAIIEVFTAADQGVRAQSRLSKDDSRRVSNLGRCLRNFPFLHKVKIGKRLYHNNLDLYLMQEVRIKSDRAFLRDMLAAANVGPGPKVDPSVLEAALKRHGFDFGRQYGLTYEVRNMLSAMTVRDNDPVDEPEDEESEEDAIDNPEGGPEDEEEIVQPAILEKPKVELPKPVPGSRVIMVGEYTATFHHGFGRLLTILHERYDWPSPDIVPLALLRALVTDIWRGSHTHPSTILGNQKKLGIIQSLGNISNGHTCWRYLPMCLRLREGHTIMPAHDDRLIEIIEAEFTNGGSTLREAVIRPPNHHNPTPTVEPAAAPDPDTAFEARVQAEVDRRVKQELRKVYLSLVTMFTELADEEKT